MRKVAALAVSLAVLAFGAGVAQAGGATRASRTVAGVKYTLNEWAHYVLTDQPKAACAMLTPNGQKVWAKQNSSKTCVQATTGDYKFLKKYPDDAKAIKDYANQKVTLSGNTAKVPKLAGGYRTLLYIDGLWYIND